MPNPIIINLRHGSKETNYIARLVWQKLFDIYRAGGGNLNDMDNMLCDHNILQIQLESAPCKEEPLLDFYWSFDAHGQTHVHLENPGYCLEYHLYWDGFSDTITITEHQPKGLQDEPGSVDP